MILKDLAKGICHRITSPGLTNKLLLHCRSRKEEWWETKTKSSMNTQMEHSRS